LQLGCALSALDEISYRSEVLLGVSCDGRAFRNPQREFIECTGSAGVSVACGSMSGFEESFFLSSSGREEFVIMAQKKQRACDHVFRLPREAVAKECLSSTQLVLDNTS